MSGDACNVNGSRDYVYKEQDVMRDETLDRADFDAQEICRRQTFPVSLQKRRPPGVRASLGSGFYPVLLKDVRDGAASNLMPEISPTRRASPDRRRSTRQRPCRELQIRGRRACHQWLAGTSLQPAWRRPCGDRRESMAVSQSSLSYP